MNELACPLCNAPIEPERKYCSRCEQLLSGSNPALPPAPSAKPKWYHNTGIVLFMISPFALGPFGLPLLWKSPRFSRPVKLGLTLFTIAWSIWACWYVASVMVPAVTKELNQINSTYGF